MFLRRQFTAALADLHEAAKLCPNNREIRRLLARVEDECKQMQRSQVKGAVAGAAAAATSGQASGGHESDPDDQDEGRGDLQEHSLARSVEGQRDILEEEEEEEDEDEEGEASLQDRTAETCWPHGSFSYSRALPSEPSSGHQSQTANLPPGSGRPPPPHRYPREPREALTQQGLVLQSTRQAQIVKTNQHMSSMQCGGGPAGGRGSGSKSQYGPSSPLPSRHLLKAGPGIDISPLSPPADEPVYGNRVGGGSFSSSSSKGYSCDNEDHHSSQTPGSSKVLGQDRLAAHSASSLDALGCFVPRPQENHPDPAKDGLCGAVGGGVSGGSSMRVSSSTSSLASSSSLSDSGKLGPDVRTKIPDKTKLASQAPTAEYKPRPFMGITDKTARFHQQLQQQQQQYALQGHQSSRSWINHSSDGLLCHSGMSVAELLHPIDYEPSFAKTSTAAYQEQLKPLLPSLPPPGAAALGGLQNGAHSKEFTDKFNCYKESKPAVAMMAHAFMDSKAKQAGLARENPALLARDNPSLLTRDNPALHVPSIKPKRSFIESNV